MGPELAEHQNKAKDELDNGKILYGGTGSGKTRTVLAYYDEKESPRDIYVITTAKKRNSLDWEKEAAAFGIFADVFITEEGYTKYHGILTVDSWNNIERYVDVKEAFFVFDEQRVVGNGEWVKNFKKITKNNRWVLLSATPGDVWMDYEPVFVANGFYKNRTDFLQKHVVWEPYVPFPKVKTYLNETKLEMLRNEILVEMPYDKHTVRHMNWVECSYDKEKFKKVFRDRWHPWEDRPIQDAAEMFRLMRRVVNTDPSRLETLRQLMPIHPRLIVFYNFDYELEILRSLGTDLDVAELNGHRHDPIPDSDKWVYLVQYVAGAEAWNCTETDAMVLWSLSYSYKNTEQTYGRIDRLDTPFVNLHYYMFVSNSIIDLAIRRALEKKRNFNEKKWAREHGLERWISDSELDRKYEKFKNASNMTNEVGK